MHRLAGVALAFAVFHLPPRVVGQGLFLNHTECLAPYERWRRSAAEEDNDAAPLSFLPDSELLITRTCTATGVQKSYFRWHGNRWHLLRQTPLSPAPPVPIE